MAPISQRQNLEENHRQLRAIKLIDKQIHMPLDVSLAVHLTLGLIPPQGDTGPYDHELVHSIHSCQKIKCWLVADIVQSHDNQVIPPFM